ncbi:RNA polymerase sigma factor [Micromonospora echinaurantiaca]|nr:RNA polymerase sigma factor [Micromonospora echinaurantiaca]
MLARRSDAALVAGPPDLFGELFERYSGWLYDYSARRVGRQLAEDLVAETFLVAFSRRDRYDLSVSSARPWLCGILTNLLRNHRRSEVRWLQALARSGVDPLAETQPISEAFDDRATERLDAQALIQSLAGALASMPRNQRDVLLLHVWAGLDYPELATALAVPPGTVRSRLHRAKARLRKALSDRHIHEECSRD